MKRMRGNFVGCQAILGALTFCMVLPMTPVLAGDNVGDSGDDQARVPSLYFEPIAGLTTTRHLAPSQTAIPLFTVLEIFLNAPEDAQVTLLGATMTSRNAEGIKATCLLNQEGPVTVAAISELSDGTRHVAACRLEVVAIAISNISATVSTAMVAPFDLGENATNAETMFHYNRDSIARLVETTPVVSDAIGLDGRRRRPIPTSVTRRFHTSISQRISFQANVVPPAFAPLMEWRFDGVGRALGAERSVTFENVGQHNVSVGPTNRALGAVIDIYSVSITSHVSGDVIIPEGEPITFEALTTPTGFEDGITWLASTKYGTGSPVRGQGRTFTVQFDSTFGDDPVNGYFQWVGLRADNATFGQDQKPAPFCCDEGIDAFGTNATIPTSITFGSFSVPPIPPGFFGAGSEAFSGSVDLVGTPRLDENGTSCRTADTFVRRLGPVLCPGAGFPRPCTPVPVEIVGLSLSGSASITVTYDNGPDQDWLIALGLPEEQSPRGALSAILEDANGGSYTATLPVRVNVAFVRESAAGAPDPLLDIKGTIRTVDMGLPNPVPWTRITPADGGFFCPATGFDIGNEFYPGEPGGNRAAGGSADSERGIDCDTCIQCSGDGCHGVPASHIHCICRPVPCPTRCRYDLTLRFPFPFCLGPSAAPVILKSSYVCNLNETDDACCGNGVIPPAGIALFPCLFGGQELVIYLNAVDCDP